MKVVIFGQQGTKDINLYKVCCRTYGDMHGNNRVFSLSHTLLLYAVLLHRLNNASDFLRRLRQLRNLIEATNIEYERMPTVLADIERVVIDGTLDGVFAFNQAQVVDERLKESLLVEHPSLEHNLFRLEDHNLLRGCVAAFELDPDMLERRAEAFQRVFAAPEHFPVLTGALLAIGDYSRPIDPRYPRFFLFGAAKNLAPWREVLTGIGRSHLGRVREVLGHLLDEVSQSEDDVPTCLEAIKLRWLVACEASPAFDWRYYFVKYDAMREGNSGRYIGQDGALGYSVCMLKNPTLHGYYRDPYLLAIHRQSGVSDAIQDPWFAGHESTPRWMRLVGSGTEMRCVEEGIALKAPLAPVSAQAFDRVRVAHGVGDDLVLHVPKVERDGKAVDAKDRVLLGAELLRDLVAAGL